MREAFHSLRFYFVLVGFLIPPALFFIDFSTVNLFLLIPALFFGFGFLYIGHKLIEKKEKKDAAKKFLIIAIAFGSISVLLFIFNLTKEQQFSGPLTNPNVYLVFLSVLAVVIATIYLLRNVERISEQAKVDWSGAYVGSAQKKPLFRTIAYFIILIAFIALLAYSVDVSLR